MKSRAAIDKVLLIVLLLLILGGGIAAWYFLLRPGPPDFQALGGTILVFEAEPQEEKDRGDPVSETLAKVLQARMHGADLPQATVIPAGKGQVEIRIAKLENHQQDIQRVKELVAKAGRLEFRILANQADDAEGQDAARKTIEAAKDLDLLEVRARKGLPPPAPLTQDGAVALFLVKLGKHQSLVSYDWVELSLMERQVLGLDDTAGADPTRNAVWLQARGQLHQAVRLNDLSGQRKLFQGALFFVRVCADQRLSEEERNAKKHEVFVLARDPEIDPKAPKQSQRTPKIDGTYISSARAITSSGPEPPAVSFTFNSAGAELFGQLTGKNVPTGAPEGPDQIRRHLAIILDGQVLSSPTINSEIRSQAQISGNFTKQEVDRLTAILRGGALPAPLKPQPISETTVEPGKK